MTVVEFPDKSAGKSPADSGKLARLQLRAKTDHLWLGNEVLGYDFQENPHRGLFNSFLQKDPEGCSCGHLLGKHNSVGICMEPGCCCLKSRRKTLPELDPEIKHRLILWQRGAFKTSGIVVEAVQLILNFPNIRIMILAGSLDESKKRLEEIKSHFEDWGEDDKLHDLFPEFCSKVKGRKMGNSRRWVCPARKRKLKDPTLAVFSPKVLKTGTHFDVILIDDLVNELNCKTAEGLQKAIADYKSILPVLEPDGYIYLTGTRYDFSDCYGWIQETIKEEKLQHWLVSLRTCWITRCKHAGCDHADVRHMDGGGRCGVEGCECQKFESNGVREVLFPQAKTRDGRTVGFTVEILEKLRKELGPGDFGCQYENDPLGGGERKFTRELLYSKLRPPQLIPARGPTVLQIDIAVSQRETADDMVIYVSRVRSGRHHVIDCVGGHIPEDQQPVVICDLILKYAPREIFIEKKTGAQYLQRLIILEAQRRKLPRLPVITLVNAENTPKAKQIRIGALLGYMTQDRVLFKLGLPYWEKLEQQLLLFPKFKGHDDYADCLARLLQAPTGFENEPLPPEPIPYWMREPKNEEPALEHGGLPYGLIG